MSDPQTRRLLLLTDFGDDIGDQAVMAGFATLLSTVSERVGIDVTLDQSSLRTLPFRPSTIETINDGYDLVVVAGAAFEAAGSASGWGFDIPEDLLESLSIPLVVYAAGRDERRYASTPGLSEEAARHLDATAHRAASFSVRDHGTIEFLRELGAKADMHFVPDPAIHVEPARVHLPQLQSERPIIAVCLRLENAHELVPPPFAESFENYVKAVVGALTQLVKDDGFQVAFTPHLLTKHDVEVGQLLSASLPEGSLIQLHEAFPGLYAGPDLETPSLIAGVYQRASVVLGQRLHSLTLPFSVSTPTVSIASARSTAAVHRELGMPDWMRLDVSEPERDITAEHIASTLRRTVQERRELAALAFVRRGELITQARAHASEWMTRTLLGADALPSTPTLRAVAS